MTKKEKLEIRLKELEEEYKLAQDGLKLGARKARKSMIFGVIILFVALAALLFTDREFLSGIHLIIIFGIMAATMTVYYSFVFGRVTKIKAKITDEIREEEITKS